jgi:hypothetical protein
VKQIERIRAMSAEQLAEWLMDHVENQNFSVDVCDNRFCPLLADADEDGVVNGCNEERCLAAAVAYLESEVEK